MLRQAIIASSFILSALAVSLVGQPELYAQLAERGPGDRTQKKVPSISAEASPLSSPQFIPRYAHRGAQRFIQHGLRIERTQESIAVSSEIFSSGGEPKLLELPDHLGGGFIFFQAVGVENESATQIYHSDSFTGPLKPLARLPFVVLHIRAGFDRLYALGTGIKVALDAETGATLGLDPLPEVVTVENVEFAGSQRATLLAPLLSVIATNNAGLNWKPVANATSLEHSSDPNQLLVRTAAGVFKLDHNLAPSIQVEAQKTHVTPIVPGASFNNEEFGADLLQVLARGVRVSDQIIAIHRARLLLAPAEGPFEVTRRTTALDPSASCVGVPDEGKSALFLCRGAQLDLLRFHAGKLSQVYSAPLNAKPLNQLSLLSFGQGAFLLKGSCPGAAAHDQQTSRATPLCYLTRRSTQTVLGPRSPNAHLSFATHLKGSWSILWNSQKNSFEVTQLSSASLTKKSLFFSVDKTDSLLELLSAGSSLPQATKTSDGFSLWVTHGEKFMGVHLTADGTVDSGALQRPLSRASFYGEKALVWGAAGFAKQSVDGGLHFNELQFPFRSGDAELSANLDPHADTQVGCGDAGCVTGHLLRRGWTAQTISEAPEVERTPLTPPGGGRHNFKCGATAISSPNRRSEAVSAFEGFWELKPPILAPAYQGISVSFPHDQARLYAYGPRDIPWNRDGRFELWYINPYSVAKVQKTRPSYHLAQDLIAAETLLGTIDQGTSFSESALDPDARAGVILLHSRGAQSLLSWLDGGPLVRVELRTESGDEVTLRGLRGVVLSKGQIYLAYLSDNASLSVARLESTGFYQLATLPLGESGSRGAQLVRSTEGNLGVAMEGDAGLFAYPLHEDGSLGPPIVAKHQSRRPLSCASEATGFVVERELALSPYLETEQGEAIKTTGLRAKMIVGSREPCIEAMTARVRTLPQLTPAQGGAQAVPLSILNADSAGNRLELLCE